jgi:GntR family transcriptional regulator/MocR family aminotransferase
VQARGELAIPINLDHGSRRSLQGRLFEQLSYLNLGWRLNQPPAVQASQAFAKQLSISGNTLWLVHDRLIVEGYLQARKAIVEPT